MRPSAKRFVILSPLFVIFLFSVTEFAFSAESEISRFPSKQLTFVCGVPPGSTGDLAPRLICREAEKFLGQSIVIVNKTGGSTVIASAAVSAAKPDGYTLGFTLPSSRVIAPHLEKIPYHPIKDFQDIIQFAESVQAVFVKHDSQFKSVNDLVAYARQNPRRLRYGTGGALNVGNFVIQQLARKEKVELTNIPFKGGNETQVAILGGHIDFVSGAFNHPLVESGEIRLLMLLGENHMPEYPGVPTLKDLGYDPNDVSPAAVFMNIAGPRGLPKEITTKLEEAFTKAMKEPGFIKGMKEMRLPIVYRNSREITEYIERYYKIYGSFLKEIGMVK